VRLVTVGYSTAWQLSYCTVTQLSTCLLGLFLSFLADPEAAAAAAEAVGGLPWPRSPHAAPQFSRENVTQQLLRTEITTVQCTECALLHHCTVLFCTLQLACDFDSSGRRIQSISPEKVDLADP